MSIPQKSETLAQPKPENTKSDGPGKLSDTALSEGKLSDAIVRNLAPSAKGNRIAYDRGAGSERGFGVRVTASGAKAFVLNYTIAGRERRITIGAYPTWSVAAARKRASELRRDIDQGIDPLNERITERDAPTVNELCDRYISEHASRKRTGAEDEAMIRKFVLPRLGGSRKVASISFSDIDRLHRKITAESGPYRANRVVALLSKMFALAIRWGMRVDNPAKGVERNPEERRYRYVAGHELGRLTDALARHPSQSAANAVRLLLLTGARRGEVMAATWNQFDLPAATWTKPSSHTKQKREHRIPLSEPARQLLVEMKAESERRAIEEGRLPSPYVFPGRDGRGSMVDLKTSWAALCKAARLEGVRLHDLRHTYASMLASAGLGLPVIGALLGHTQPGTTARYTHLFDDPLRAATEHVAAIVTGARSSGTVVTMPPRTERG